MTKKFALALATLMVLAFIAVGSASAAPSYGKNVTVGDAIFIGESGLCISQAVGGNTKLAWFAPSANITTDQPAIVYSIGDNQSFYVQDAMFGAYEGAWYKYTGSQPGGARLAFYVYKPSLSVSIWDIGTTGSATDVTGKKVTTGDNVTFRIPLSYKFQGIYHNYDNDY